MNTPSRDITPTTASAGHPHEIRSRPTAELDHYERQRLFGITTPTTTLTRRRCGCGCGWSTAPDNVLPRPTAVAHLDRDPALPVHHVGGHTRVGSRPLNADSYGSTVDDTTGLAAIAVADGIGSHPGSATAAATTTTAPGAALTASTSNAASNAAVSGLLAARDALTAHEDLTGGRDTVTVVAVSRPPAPHDSLIRDIAWVGDCRAYLLEDTLLTRLTTDHTVGERIRQADRPEPPAACNDNVVVTSVGTADPLTLGTAVARTEGGRLAPVGDGGGKGVEPAVLHEVLREVGDLGEAAEFLVGFGVDRPRADNATALVIDTHPLRPRIHPAARPAVPVLAALTVPVNRRCADTRAWRLP
ncbi:PP2C family protein-serine/threonine phosphatase [Saccharothrix lopnurensis]|uniref:PP2C family protein-serine/threonine phosphatase n=1 Tax=Saccharothrix lopnurensis TaxID=1670621 RepID=A0ABW1PGT9_9PSEU